ncbi:MAG: hypothetical protein GTO14_25690 [Anaerolineales bacterium]|nr:hypothetical protein [Anaerolineales bacterium]
MRRLFSRLVIVGILTAIGWIGYQISDFTTCEGPGAEAWVNATTDRLEAADYDYTSWDDYTTLGQFSVLAVQAEKRYREQLEQETIKCLKDLHDHNIDFFWYEWKMYEAASNGDFELAAQYDAESIRASEAAMREFDRMAEKYNWDLD